MEEGEWNPLSRLSFSTVQWGWGQGPLSSCTSTIIVYGLCYNFSVLINTFSESIKAELFGAKNLSTAKFSGTFLRFCKPCGIIWVKRTRSQQRQWLALEGISNLMQDGSSSGAGQLISDLVLQKEFKFVHMRLTERKCELRDLFLNTFRNILRALFH